MHTLAQQDDDKYYVYTLRVEEGVQGIDFNECTSKSLKLYMATTLIVTTYRKCFSWKVYLEWTFFDFTHANVYNAHIFYKH